MLHNNLVILKAECKIGISKPNVIRLVQLIYMHTYIHFQTFQKGEIKGVSETKKIEKLNIIQSVTFRNQKISELNVETF